MNPMRLIRIEKITLNIGAGKDQERLEKGMKLLKYITNRNPLKTFTKKRIPAWGLRPGLPIGCKVTLRKAAARELLKRLLDANNNVMKLEQFDDSGNLAFGIHEYLNIPEVKYKPELGIMGLEVCVTLERPGFRIRRRKLNKKKIPKGHAIRKEEAMEFMKKEFNVKIGEEE